MSQSYPNVAASDAVKDSLAPLLARDDALRSNFAGAAAPSSPVYGQLFIDSDDNTIEVCINATGPVWAALGACLAANTVPIAKIAASATNKLFGRFTALAGAGEEISLGTGISFVAGALTVNVATALGYTPLNASYLDTDGTLAANSDSKIASQKAVKTYVDQIIAAQDAMVFKGAVNCSANPNYPAADTGHTYRVSAAGKIGGASGVNVEVGDLLMCITDATAEGTQGAVGSAWTIAQTNLDGTVIGPESAVDNRVPVFNGVSGKLIKDSGLTLSGNNTGDQTIALTGNVTGSGTGSFAATIANGAVTYAKMQNVSTNSRYLGKLTAGAGVVEEVAPWNMLDGIGAVQGNILYRGSGYWQALAPGTAGQCLVTGGSSANPSWGSPASLALTANSTLTLSQNADTKLSISNTNAGASAAAKLELISDGGTASIAMLAHEQFFADYLYISAPKSIAMAAVAAGSQIAFAVNGSTQLIINEMKLQASVPVQLPTFTVNTLPSASAVGAGARAEVSDCNTTTFNATATTGGSNTMGVRSDASNWKVG